MNREDLALAIMEKQPKDFPSKAAVDKAVKAVLEEIQCAVARGDSVVLPGFGSFKAVERAARVARNPQTGEELNVPARRAPVFKPGKAFKDAVNK